MSVKKFAGASAAGIASVVLVLGGAGVAGALPGAGSLGSLTGSVGGDQCGTTVVTPEAMGDWATPRDETPAAIVAAGANDADFGNGVLTFPEDSAEKPGTSLYNEVKIPLSDLLDDEGKAEVFQFDYTTSGQAPALQLRIVGANYNESMAESDAASGAKHFESGFATIVWSPAAADGSWKKADTTGSDQFWVTRSIDGTETLPELNRGPGNMDTLENIIARNPDATLIGYGVQQTRENDSTDVKVDNFTIGCQVTDFEVTAPGPFGSLAGLFGSVGSSEQ
ncbi:hypothetical protein [Tomitella cavernea]|uniref:Secreted protein n=1 Tax=Tomitella cavernea TaxID=1387982 RepID=A0ABP9CHH2_9ACTN|nr:hypothetical protein [Tomitella cavernea]